MTNLVAIETNWRAIGDTTLDVWHAEVASVRRPDGSQPMLNGLAETYQAAKPHSALFLAQAWLENQYETTGHIIFPHHHNPVSLRPWVDDPVHGRLGPFGADILHSAAGDFLVFRSDADCAKEWKRRIDTEAETYKGGVYARTTSLERYLAVYAPAGDKHPVTGLDNADIGYLSAVVTKLRAFAAKEGTLSVPEEVTGMASHRYILSMGHRNTDGGGAVREQEFNIIVTKLLRDAIKFRGGEAFIVHEHDGDNDPEFSVGRGLQNVARRCVELAPALGPFDAYLSMHYEGGPARGFFGIFAEGGTVDSRRSNARDIELIRAIANAVERTGMPKRTAGVVEPAVMSERQTGVGAQGFRLGEFVGTLGFQSTTCRLILEAGNYANLSDRAMLWSPTWQADYVQAIVDGLETVFGKFSGTSQVPRVEPPPVQTTNGLAFPPGMDAGVAAGLFGEVKGNNGTLYKFDPNGSITRAWLECGKTSGAFPRLVSVQVYGEGTPEQRSYFQFSDGLVLWSAKQGGAFMPLKG